MRVCMCESVCVCMYVQGYFIGGGGRGGIAPPLNFDNPKRSRIWEAYVVVRLAAT